MCGAAAHHRRPRGQGMCFARSHWTNVSGSAEDVLDSDDVVGQSKLMTRADPTQTAGSRLRSRDVAGFVVADAQYRPHVTVAPHVHARAGLAFIVAGRYAKRIGRAERECGPGTMTFEPPGV